MKKIITAMIIVSVVCTFLISCSKPETQEETTIKNVTTNISETTITETTTTTTQKTTESTTKKEATNKIQTTKKHTTSKKHTTTKQNNSSNIPITLTKKGKEIIKQIGVMSFNEVIDDVSKFDSFNIAVEGNEIITYTEKTKSGLNAKITCSKNGDNSNDIFISTSKYDYRLYSIINGKPETNRAVYVVVKNAKDHTYISYSNAQEKYCIEEAVYKVDDGYKLYNSYFNDGKLVEFEEDYDINNPPICY